MKIVTIILCLFLTSCSWSKTDIIFGMASTLATGADTYTTERLLNNPDNHENNPMMNKHPSDTELVTYMLSAQLLTLIVAHIFPEWRTWILGSKTAVNTGFAIHNTTLDWGE